MTTYSYCEKNSVGVEEKRLNSGTKKVSEVVKDVAGLLVMYAVATVVVLFEASAYIKF